MTIRNDATRSRITPSEPRRLRSVAARQGQVLLEADLNANTALQLERTEAETRDLLAPPGRLAVPAGDTGFRITAAASLPLTQIGAGHGYLDGWLLDTAACTLATQPHPRLADATPAPVAFVLKALLRHLDPAEERVFADKALGDAQAPGRVLNDWQVFPFGLPTGYTAGCTGVAGLADWPKLVAPSSGQMKLEVSGGGGSTNACSLIPAGGYARLENLLYRIEVHDGVAKAGWPTADGPRFGLQGLKLKLSRRNGSVMAQITDLTAATGEFTVAPALLDPVNWFAPGRLAEIVSLHDDASPRAGGAPERLFQVADAQDDRVTLAASAAAITATGVTTNGKWALRLWEPFPDGVLLAEASAAQGDGFSTAISLGDGLSIRLGDANGVFRRGDFWTFSARADGTTDWPAANARTPDGPQTRYTVLAAPLASGTLSDCRVPFARASDAILLYRGGDGQAIPVAAALPADGMLPLNAPLRLAVMLGQNPVPNARIEWRPVGTAPPGRLAGAVPTSAAPVVTMTNANGLVEARWEIDGNQPLAAFRIQAQLVVEGAAISPPVEFTAGFLTALGTSYQPGACSHLNASHDVQTALDTLCNLIGIEKEPETLSLTQIDLIGKGGNETGLIKEKLILNGLAVAPFDFLQGIRFVVDGPLDTMTVEPFDPVAEVTLDLPYPGDDYSRLYWSDVTRDPLTGLGLNTAFGYHPLRLAGEIFVVAKNAKGVGEIFWKPLPGTQEFLNLIPQHQFGQRNGPARQADMKKEGWKGAQVNQVVCRLRLRAAMIHGTGKKTKKPVWLNAEHLGTSAAITRRELLLAERDPQRAGDLDMFIYLGMG